MIETSKLLGGKQQRIKCCLATLLTLLQQEKKGCVKKHKGLISKCRIATLIVINSYKSML